MKKWLVYVLGIVTGFVLSIIPAITISFFINKSNDLGIEGLQMFDEPGENMGQRRNSVAGLSKIDRQTVGFLIRIS